MMGEQPLQSLSKILEQVKPIGTLLGLGSACARSSGIFPTPISTDHANSRALAHPGGCGFGLAVWKQIQDAMPLQVHQDRAEPPAAPEAKIVDAQLLHGARSHVRQRHDPA
jgi:hypothetical protein